MTIFVLLLSTLFFLPLVVDSFAVYQYPLGALTKWPVNLASNTVPVPYYYNLTDLSPQEYQNFLAAAQIIQTGTDNCIQFNKRDVSAGWISAGPIVGGNGMIDIPIIPGPNTTVILKNRKNGIQLDICHTFAGMYNGAAGQIMFVGSNTANRQLGCLSRTGDREAVRVLMNLLGVASEFQRQDRDTYLTNDDSLMLDSAKAFFKVQPNLNYNSDSFDYESVTMPTPTRFAKNKLSPHFKYKDSTKRVPPAAYFSLGDCQALSYLYGCKLDCSEIIYPLESPNFKTVIKNKDSVLGVNCWPTSTDLATAEKILEIDATSVSGDKFQIDGEDTEYLKLSRVSPSKRDIQLTKSITSNTKLEFLLTIDKSLNSLMTRGIMTIDLRCRPYPTEASEIFVSGSGSALQPHKLPPLPPGFIGGTRPAAELRNLVGKPKICKKADPADLTGTIIPNGYSFRPFPVDSSIIKLRIISQYMTGSLTTPVTDWDLDSATQTIYATKDITITGLSYELTFEYYIMDPSGAQVTQQFSLMALTFDCTGASTSRRH